MPAMQFDPALICEIEHQRRRRQPLPPPELLTADEAEVARILALSDDEVIAECIAEGFDPATEAARMRKLFEDMVQKVRAEEAARAGERVNAAFERSTQP